ncbi:MAG TPA: bifunctional oligoribonuclease/PAP phosphatase NrnA [Blastocatellia bacterium]|jgi:phosphoesterase RecJ-like protein|nr:bifunctional oligoribonuclease/PAP phosphatase NrnA [Blastocatellia bacterium]
MLSQVVQLIEHRQRFMITSHIRPDGDGLGSGLALYWMLRSMGKEVDVVLRDRVPPAYMVLPGSELVLVQDDVTDIYDAAFIIECSDVERPGLPSLRHQFVVNIDHHSTTEPFGDINWIDSTAAAVGEMVYNLCKALGLEVTKEIAECIYTALLTDTGSFHFSNTTERTLKIASELVRRGVEPARISQALFYSYPFSKIRLLGLVLSGIERDESGRIAWVVMDRAMMYEAGASEEDSDGIVNHALSIGEVEAVAFFKELSPGVYRVSLRSKNRHNVARVAEQFGGGGHRNAAGCRISGDFEDVKRRVIERLQAAVGVAPVSA